LKRGQETEQTPRDIARGLEVFLAQNPRAWVLEDGKAIFEMHTAKSRLSTEHGRCTLPLWSEERKREEG